MRVSTERLDENYKMKVAILGYGKQGKSAYNYWSRDSENDITICDRMSDLELPFNVHTKLGNDYLADLDQFDVIVRSPSIHPRDIITANSPAILRKVTSVTNEFLRVCPSKHIIGVTGTKGKGTTSSLIAKMLEAANFRVHIGGNIGTPPLDLLKEDIMADDYVVLELANFQLIDTQYSPHIGVCLMVVPEHLDWHPDVKEYYASKKQMFVWQTTDDIAIYYAKNEISREIASAGNGKKIPYMTLPGAEIINGNLIIDNQVICKTNEIKLLGEHNQQNACAAVTAVWNITQNVDAISSVLTSFSGLPHRLEFVGTVNVVDYYDDSFGTTPETTIVALQAFSQPKVVILGGSDKGSSYDELAKVVKSSNVQRAVLIGEQYTRIRAALEDAGYTDLVSGGSTMTDIVKTAKSVADAGSVVLLSPGCASFDMFKNYEDRGDQFKAAVQLLVSTAQ